MSIDLTAANEAAMADIQAANAAPETPAPVAETPAPAAAAPETPVAETPAPVATPPVAADTPAPEAQAPAVVAKEEPVAQKWTFTRKGQQVEITDPQQAAELIRQGYDYTQKTMELADFRRELEAKVRSVLTNPQLLRAQLAEIERQQGPVTTPVPQDEPPDPTDLVTHQHAQQLLRAQQAQVQRQTEEMVNRAILKAETHRYAEEYTSEVNRTMATLVNEKFPILKDVEKIEKLILDDVSDQVKARIAMNPDEQVEISEVKLLIAKAAEKRADKLQARVKEHLKMEQVRAAKVVQSGIEPPAAPAPAPKPAPAYKLNDPRLTELILQDLNAAFSKK